MGRDLLSREPLSLSSSAQLSNYSKNLNLVAGEEKH